MNKSKDLRERAVAYKKEGHTYEETAKVFGVVKSTIHRWEKQHYETGDLSDKPLDRGFKKTDPEKLRKYVEERPDDMQAEVAASHSHHSVCVILFIFFSYFCHLRR